MRTMSESFFSARLIQERLTFRGRELIKGLKTEASANLLVSMMAAFVGPRIIAVVLLHILLMPRWRALVWG